MKTMTFGIEIETTGLRRQKAAETIATLIHGNVTHAGGPYDRWNATAPDGRTWSCCHDGSVTGATTGNMAEIVSPILTWADIETVQTIVRALKSAGAKTDASCGIHIHVGAQGMDTASLIRLCKMDAAKEGLMAQSFGISEDRRQRWCQPISTSFMMRLNRAKPKTLEDFAKCWYGDQSWESHAANHYDHSRYHLLNLHSLFQKGKIENGKVTRLGTIEFRAFNGTLHAGKIKAYIQFCLALVAMAKASKSASARVSITDNPKYAMRCWLLRLGFIGDEFTTARKHLTDLLPGDCAFRHGRPGTRAA